MCLREYNQASRWTSIGFPTDLDHRLLQATRTLVQKRVAVRAQVRDTFHLSFDDFVQFPDDSRHTTVYAVVMEPIRHRRMQVDPTDVGMHGSSASSAPRVETKLSSRTRSRFGSMTSRVCPRLGMIDRNFAGSNGERISSGKLSGSLNRHRCVHLPRQLAVSYLG